MTQRYFAMIADSDVFGVITFEDSPSENVDGPRLAAGLSSSPVIVELTDESVRTLVRAGWTWDGTTFYPPAE